MIRERIIHMVFAASTLFLMVSCQQRKVGKQETLPQYNSEELTPEWNATKGLHKIKPFEFVNQEGKKVSDKDFKNKIYVANFFFTTCPGICPKMESMMSLLQNEYLEDEEVLLLSYSVTPEIDSVEVLKEYAENHDILSHKWHLLTGDRNELYIHTRSSYFADEDFGKKYSPESDFIHTENFYLIDKTNRIRGVYNGTLEVEINRIISDIETLKL